MNERQQSNAHDLQIVSSVLQGDNESFQIVVEKYYSTIFRLSRSYMHSVEEAEDVTQEVFLRAFRSLHRFKLEKQFSNWLYTIAVNYLKTRYSKILRLKDKTEQLQQEPGKSRAGPEEITEKKEQQREILSAIEQLPTKLKVPVMLYYIEEENVKNISAVLSISEENVKSRLHRARKKLREILEKNATNSA